MLLLLHFPLKEMTTNETRTADQQLLELTTRVEAIERRLARLEPKTEPNDYNGWSNYETWVVSLWMDNDAKQYLQNRALAEKHLVAYKWDRQDAAVAFAKDLRQQTEDAAPDYLKGPYVDLLNGALSSVDYFEIAQNWVDGIDPPAPKAEPTPAPQAIGPEDKPSPDKPKTAKPRSEAKATLTADDAVLDILKRSTIDDEGLTLPPEQLPREQYDAVNAFLEVAGANWNKKSKRHLFKPGAKAKIEGLLGTGQILDEKKHYQAFYTPDETARELVRIADVRPDMECLEPSAGAGAIARCLREAGAFVTCIELNPEATEVLRFDGFNAFTGDFLSVTPEKKYDRVVMNPPFTGDQDIDHVLHAFKFLKPGGKLVAIMGKSFTFGEQKKRSEFRRFVEDNGRVVRDLPRGTFEESGTMVETVVVELTKQQALQASLLAA